MPRLHRLTQRATAATFSHQEGRQGGTLRFGDPTQLGIRAQLKGNERALQLYGDANELLAGTLKEGDHVDVVTTWTVGSENNGTKVSKVILRNLLVLKAEDAASVAKLTGPNDALSVQVRATDAQMQKVFWARKNGIGLSLLLRPPSQATNSPRSVDDAHTLLMTR